VSLSDRLSEAKANRGNHGCVTCQWLLTLTNSDRAAFTAWVDAGSSLAQLHSIASSDPDKPLTVSLSALRDHRKYHHHDS
jgi:hypothetical protein